MAQLGIAIAPARDAAGAGNSGVVVTGVDPNGSASDHGIVAGDVILNVGGQTVSTPADVRSALRQASAENKHSLLLRVKTANGMRFLALPISQG
jgi:serine protease Do